MSERDGVRRVVLSDPWKAAPAPGSLQMDELMAALQEREGTGLARRVLSSQRSRIARVRVGLHLYQL